MQMNFCKFTLLHTDAQKQLFSAACDAPKMRRNEDLYVRTIRKKL